MAEYTPNYNLYKPNRADAEPIDTTLTANFQAIDNEMKKRETDIIDLSNGLDAKTSELQSHIDSETFNLQEQIDTKTTLLQDQVDNLVLNGDSSPAIAHALAGTSFGTLREKLDSTDAQLNQNANMVKDIREQRPKLYFNGGFNNYVSAKVAELKDAIAIECEFNLDENPRSAYGRLVMQSFNGKNGAEDCTFGLMFTNFNQVRLRINFEDGTNIDINDPAGVIYGELHKVFVRWDNTTGIAELYVDDVLKASSTPNHGKIRYNPDYTLNIGAVLGNYPYQGTIGRTRIWGSSLTPEQVDNGYEPTPVYDSLIPFSYTVTGNIQYQDYAAVVSRVQAFNEFEAIGKDSSGQYDLYAIYLGTKGKPAIMLNASMHGTEWYGTQYLLGVMESLRDNTYPDSEFRSYLMSNFYIVCIPVLNPYGMDHVVDPLLQYDDNARYNANRNELNGDFAEGVQTQQETKILMNMVKRFTPFAYKDIHMFQPTMPEAGGNYLIIGGGHEETDFLRDVIADSWETLTGLTVQRWPRQNAPSNGLARAFVARTPNPYTPYTLSYITEICRPATIDGALIQPILPEDIYKFGFASLHFFFKTSTQYYENSIKGQLHDFALNDGVGKDILDNIGQGKKVDFVGDPIWKGLETVPPNKLEQKVNQILLSSNLKYKFGEVSPIHAAATPSVLEPGDYHYYLSGGGSADLVMVQSFLDSIGITPQSYGTTIDSLRLQVENSINANGTGIQRVTIFNWSSTTGYEPYAKFFRASNSGSNWGVWKEEVFVVEKGTTPNGEYIRYSDGMQHCWGEPFSIATSVAIGALFRSENTLWTYPKPFKDSTVVVTGDISAIGTWLTIADGTSSTSVNIQSISYYNQAGPYRVHLQAIGRWR